MKFSNYNIFAEWGDFHIGINLMSGKKIVFLTEDYKLFMSQDINKIEQNNRDLYHNLVACGFIIDEKDNEFSKLIHKRNQDVFYNNNSYRLTILPTLECNFRCWYCYEKHIQGKMTLQVFERVKKYIHYIFDNAPIFRFHLDWFGGEPLLCFGEVMYPISLYIMEQTKNRGMHFSNSITTNGYLIDDDMIEKFKEIKLNSFQITLDGYQDVHDKTRHPIGQKGSYAEIIRNVNKICSSIPEANITLRINFTNKTVPDIHKIIDDIHVDNRKKLEVSFQRVWQTINKEDDAESNLEEEIDLIREKGVFVQYNTFTYNHGCICYADSVRQSVVNYDGSLFKCTARDFASSDQAVGYIDDDGKPVWNNNYYKHFLKAPFDNDECRKCEYAPACLGVCSQKYIESGDDFLQKHCNKNDCKLTIENDLLNSLCDYIDTQLNQ